MIVVGQQEGALIIVLGNCGGSRWGKDNQRAKEGVHFLHSSMPMPEIGPWLLDHLPHTGASATILTGHIKQDVTSRQDYPLQALSATLHA